MSLNDTLSTLMSDESIEKLSEQTGTEKSDVKSILNEAVPAILQSAKTSSASKDGTSAMSSIASAVKGVDLSSLSSLLGSGSSDKVSSLVESLLGGSASTLIKNISKKTGVSSANVKKIISSIAPMIFGSASSDSESTGTDIASLISKAAGGKFDLSAASSLLEDKDGNGIPDALEGSGSSAASGVVSFLKKLRG